MAKGNGATLRADHLALPVYDAAASLAFYGDVLGLPLVEVHEGDDWGGKTWLMMVFGLEDGRQIAIIAFDGLKKPKAESLPPDARHYACSAPTRAALGAWKKKLQAANVKFWEEDHGDQQSIYFADPNDIIWEITAPPSKVAKSDKSGRRRAEEWIAARSRTKAAR
jgi:catechol 2,3-dioxygenase-like lactoylglutathione lyase family enzyme